MIIKKIKILLIIIFILNIYSSDVLAKQEAKILFRINNEIITNLDIKKEAQYLIALNIASIFLGLPLSIIFDFILIKIFGLNYVLFFSPTLTILSVIQVLILRKIKFKFSRNILFLKKPEKNNLYKFFENITFRSFYILIIRSFPILPHVLGSYIIASSKIKKKFIIINTFLGSFFYYVFLYLIIGNA